MASPPRRSRVPVTRDARGMIPPSHATYTDGVSTFVFTSAQARRCKSQGPTFGSSAQPH